MEDDAVTQQELGMGDPASRDRLGVANENHGYKKAAGALPSCGQKLPGTRVKTRQATGSHDAVKLQIREMKLQRPWIPVAKKIRNTIWIWSFILALVHCVGAGIEEDPCKHIQAVNHDVDPSTHEYTTWGARVRVCVGSLLA